MNKQKLILAFVLILTCSLTAVASDIYKSVDANGVVEYSDRPSPDAERIEVKPNVVQTNPVVRRTPAVSSVDTSSTETSSARQSNAATDDARTTNRREREARAKNQEEDNNELVVDHDPGRATRNAIRNAAGP